MRKWNSVAIAFVTVLALLIPLGGCGSDSKDTATTTAKVENPEQVFKDIVQKAANRNTAVEDVYAMDASSAVALITTPDHDGKALIKKGQRAQPDDLKRENIQVSNIQTRGALMAADITWTAVFTEQGQKKQVPVSGTVVLRNENGAWKQLVMGIVEVTPITAMSVRHSAASRLSFSPSRTIARQITALDGCDHQGFLRSQIRAKYLPVPSPNMIYSCRTMYTASRTNR